MYAHEPWPFVALARVSHGASSQAVPPAQLVVGSVVPGFVPLGGVVYYRVSINDYNLNDEVVVEPTGEGSVSLSKREKEEIPFPF